MRHMKGLDADGKKQLGAAFNKAKGAVGYRYQCL